MTHVSRVSPRHRSPRAPVAILWIAVAGHLLLSSVAVIGQPPAFEVASVRLWAAGIPGAQRVTDTRVDLIGVPLHDVLLVAFGVHAYQLAAPEWTTDVRVDIRATLPDGAARAQVPGMLQALLVERFALVTRVARRPVPVYELMVGEGGIAMTEVQPANELTAPEAASAERRMSAVLESVEGSTRMSMWPGGTSAVTARTRYDLLNTNRNTQMLDAARMTMTEFARVLSSRVDRPVVDRTGLTGVYRFTIELPPDLRLTRALIRDGRLGDPLGASPFSAVESLGLRLVRRDSPVDVVFVDHLERVPTRN